MDYIRFGLLACIVATALFLAKQWTSFEAAHKTPVAITQSIQSNSYNDAISNDDIASIDDIPLAPAGTQNTAIPTVINNAADNIRIITDVLDLRINLKGGDIVRAALLDFNTSLEDNAEAFVLLENNNQRHYIAQSGLICRNGTDNKNGRPMYSAALKEYRLNDGDTELNVDLQQVVNNVVITKRYVLTRGSHAVKVQHIVQNNSGDDWQAALYSQLKRDNTELPSTGGGAFAMKPFLGAATRSEDKPYKKMKFKDFAEKPYKATVSGSYISIVQHYFISAWIPSPSDVTTVTTKRSQSGDNLIRFTGPLTTVANGDTDVIEATFYAGPKDQYNLEKIAPGLELTVDYGWLWWIAQPIFWCLTKIQSIVGNWGWSIIFLTLGIKLVFFRLSAASYRSMAKMRQLTPKMQAIRERLGDDKQKQSAEVMALYKKEKVNPLGGCLPVLIQMPVFISLYWVLSESVELRHSPWMFWINDLSAMDPYFILPLLMGASMFVQQSLNPAPPDPMQAKLMKWLPVMFTFFFLFFPSGLVLYWVVNNVLSISQQWVITRSIEKAAEN